MAMGFAVKPKGHDRGLSCTLKRPVVGCLDVPPRLQCTAAKLIAGESEVG